MNKGENNFVKEITSKEDDYSQWYIDVILKTQMADYTPVKGCMAIRPYGYSLWENMKHHLDTRFKKTGHKNAYFPLFIPESLLQKEVDHVEGFAPEVAWVTRGGNEELTERLAIRPTSETIVCSLYAKWVSSYRDLPVLINLWNSVVRWEKSTKPFLRTAEFLWQEGHTAHATKEDAEAETLQMLEVYRDFVENDLAIPVVKGLKTEKEKFAGALKTYSIEALMSDGKALQAGTSHDLGQHFAKVFDIKYLDKDGILKHVWTTSWGTSTRLIGAIIMVHGDNRGLKLPPRVAPVQIIIVPIISNQMKDSILVKSKEIKAILEDKYRVEIDDRDEYTPGWKFNEWEMKGVPIRIEIGPRDLEKNQVVLVRRDTGSKASVSQEGILQTIDKLLGDIQQNMFEQALKFREENTWEAEGFDELSRLIQEKRGFVKSFWCGQNECEAKIKEETGATFRCLPLEQPEIMGKCVCCGKKGKALAYIAKAY